MGKHFTVWWPSDHGKSRSYGFPVVSGVIDTISIPQERHKPIHHVADLPQPVLTPTARSWLHTVRKPQQGVP